MIKGVVRIALLTGIGLLAIACGGGGGPTPTSSLTPAATATLTPSPAPTEAGAREILVTVKDFFFAPSSIKVGPGEQVRFTVTNAGLIFHTFTIAMSSGKEQIFIDLDLDSGETKGEVITIPEGVTSLYLFCRIHESSRGMTGDVHTGDLGESLIPPPSTPDSNIPGY